MKNNILGKLTISALLIISLDSFANSEKPNVTIFATGGTIAGSAASSSDTTNYTAGTLGINTLLKAVPDIEKIATVKGEQVANVDSNDITQDILLSLVKKVNATLRDPKQKGVVITHGTDTLEETAFFLDLTLKTDKPVVLVGAMRPATAISADGPMNLLGAVSLSADANAKGRGVMVVLNDRIASGFYVNKTNALALDSFKSSEQGYLGALVNGVPKFYYPPVAPLSKPYFDVARQRQLPKVVVLYGYQGQDDRSLYRAMEDGAKGVVIAASGNGTLPKALEKAVSDCMRQGIPVVLASKTGNGFVTAKTLGIGSGIYTPSKARILLSLALADGSDMQQIRRYFEG